MDDPHQLHQLHQLLRNHIIEICHELLPGGRVISQEYRASNINGGQGKGKNGGSLAVCLNGSKAGVWSDFATGEGGDVFSLIQITKNMSFLAATAWANEFCGLSPGLKRTSQTKKTPSPTSHPEVKKSTGPDLGRQRRGLALEIWRSSIPIDGTIGQKYLENRKITYFPPSVRFMARLLHHPSGMVFPALICEVLDIAGDFMGVWRIWICSDGDGRPEITPNKMGLGSAKGGAVRLAPATDCLAIAEGLESGLSAISARPDIPVWAALSTSGMQNINIPKTVEKLYILTDHDPAGIKASRILRTRLQRNLITVITVKSPEPGEDFNDILRRKT